MRWLLVLALVGCKSRGTIEVSFTRDPAMQVCLANGTTAVLYAERNRSCVEDCACGACFGGAGVDGCGGDCELAADGTLAGVDLDLAPGHWAVVMAVLDVDRIEIAQGCVEIDVDADGTASPAPLSAPVECAICP